MFLFEYEWSIIRDEDTSDFVNTSFEQPSFFFHIHIYKPMDRSFLLHIHIKEKQLSLHYKKI